MLLWCINVPDISTPQGIAIIENVVSCLLNIKDPMLRKLVKDLQIHKHTATCKKIGKTIIVKVFLNQQVKMLYVEASMKHLLTMGIFVY